ncbi:E3 ubiquitin-protein ligase TRIM71-like [Ostrea edulis]|uniref:E3 ubiquitin-protein ligase TRIM71-like n=1 Tax=Ostrea edulis TaxID=37623 RepID=UPI0024AE9AB7|nr:E3 ubiquitin-protein ligase TRIM71-like [Ostrea edulis]XP_056007499.1 E3 ubiquitin-protein ligase TRIM71-like [Ostrea edulis]XP_056007500.1 E3 ubiquitin-protein ligase TRIM71-like [Ostrea edulis]XP_056007501.1 E3 ubiquitin-protein ligase TRIM71-like [Ostrea edulis]XP_056007502.1 E3 ubiquitin-protein ligase TRIM71-like [Ostrea edulis]XP_056007503.1 E3 ubiquitin-protein ligase TRIM71-like [Ostrea edulis]XP_056007505.1 E3 ubiquitin-protein ligase TRIM71-like [Ostrea edulis]XP_056007506.1 E3 
MDTLGLSTQCKLRQCSQCQRDTEFYCNTCKRDLCLQCKKKHVTENNTKYHNVVFYITRHTERSFTTQCKLRQCSQCQGDTEFYCNTCKRDLCLHCKEKHVIDLDTIYHDVVIYREKFNCFPLRETCVRHPKRKYRMFCDQCNYSVCKRCTDHRTHALLDLRTAYQTKRQQHREIIDNIRSETLYNCRVLLAGIQTDIQTCPPQICHRQSQMSTKAQRLKDLIDTVVCDVKLLIDRIQQQKRKMNRQLVHLQNYEDRYEQSGNRAVQFLLFIKTSRVPQIKNSPSQLLSVITEIQMTTGKRQVGIDECVKLMSTPVLHTSVCVTGVSEVLHISRVMSDRVWVSDFNNLILTDTTGDTIHRVTDITPWHGGGLHTVNSSGELIYIDSERNINKLCTDNKTVTRLIQRPSPWIPHCVYCSPSTGDLMVGMYNTDTETGKVTRYNSSGQHILTIEHDNTGHTLYSYPLYITENNNGDIIVSDWIINYNHGAVVVTERGGRHRLSYTEPPSGSSLVPLGICTDALSHILVCDLNTHTVQMIDKDGHFLSLLLIPHGINYPYSLNYDDKTHLLWVGSWDTNTVSVYRYLQRRYSLTDYPDSEEEDTREESDTDDEDSRGKSDTDDEDARGKSYSDDEDTRGKSDSDDEDAWGKFDTEDKDASGKSDADDKDARGKSDTDDEDARGKSDTDDEDARGKSYSDDEDTRGKSDSDDEDARGKSDDEDARGKSDDEDASGKSYSDDESTSKKSYPKSFWQRCILV